MTAPLAKLQYLRQWRRTNVERVKFLNRRYRSENRDQLNAKDRADRLAQTPEQREVARQRARRWYENNRDRAFVGSLKRKYGLSLDEWKAMLSRQRGRCASCGFIFTGASKYTKPHVDHCHKTGKVRGLVCSPCNLTLGTVKESIARLRGLIRYLRRSS